MLYYRDSSIQRNYWNTNEFSSTANHFQPRQWGRCQERAQDRFRNAAKVTSGSILYTHTYGTVSRGKKCIISGIVRMRVGRALPKFLGTFLVGLGAFLVNKRSLISSKMPRNWTLNCFLGFTYLLYYMINWLKSWISRSEKSCTRRPNWGRVNLGNPRKNAFFSSGNICMLQILFYGWRKHTLADI